MVYKQSWQLVLAEVEEAETGRKKRSEEEFEDRVSLFQISLSGRED